MKAINIKLSVLMERVNIKEFYTRGTLRGIRISRLAKILTLYIDWLRYWN